MYGYKGNGTITFYYDDNKLFNDVSMLSSFMAKSLSTAESSVIDELSITSDEREVYMTCVKQALPNIYETMVKIASGIDDAVNDSEKVDATETEGLMREAGTYIALTIMDNGCSNKSAIKLVDDTIETCLKYGVLSEFYSICLHPDLKGIANNKYAASLMQLQQRLFQLKKKSAMPKRGAAVEIPEGYEILFVKK